MYGNNLQINRPKFKYNVKISIFMNGQEKATYNYK